MNAVCKRLFKRWLELSAEFRGRPLTKTKPTNEEERFLTNAAKQASEAELMNMLDWAFHGTDGYALFLQGKRTFDDSKPKPYLGIETLFKDTKLAKRIELGEEWAHKDDPTEASKEDKWVQDVALPALATLVESPEDYDRAYDWWAERRGRHPQGAAGDLEYIRVLLLLREFKANAGEQ